MRVFLTGGTGFIGGHVARKLRERGDDVRALVRSPEKGAALEALGCELVVGRPLRRGGDRRRARGLRRGDPRRRRLRGRDPGERAPSDVRGERARHRARAGGGARRRRRRRSSTSRPIGAFGNTHGEVVDESYEHPGSEFTSYYEQTKYEAHQIAKRLIAEEGLPCVIVQPGGVYGPDDHSAIGNADQRSSSPGGCR